MRYTCSLPLHTYVLRVLGGLFPTALLLLPTVAYGQTPTITSASVVSAGSFAGPIAPGSLAAVFGTSLASSQAQATGLPLSTNLGGASVTVNGVKAPLLFVSPTQINFEVPASLSVSSSAYGSVSVAVVTTSGASASVPVSTYVSNPAAFTVDGSGCGQAAALNVAPSGGLSLNSATNSAAPGDYVGLYLTGLGLPSVAVADGSASTGTDPVQVVPGVWLDGTLLPSLPYAGTAPGLAGVNQVNFQIPLGTREGCSIPVAVQAEGLLSPLVTLSIHTGRGQCVDSPIQSFGQVSLTKTTTSGPGAGDIETLTAMLPSGPGLVTPTQTVTVGEQVDNASDPVPVSRSCAVPSYQELSAGALQIQPGSGATVTAQPMPNVNGVYYEQPLTAGFIAAGQYTVSASGGPVTFHGQLAVGSPIQIKTPPAAGTQISSSQPLTINWTGGAAGTTVKVILVSRTGIANPYDYATVSGDAGTVTLVPVCSGSAGSALCSFGLPVGTDAEVIVEVTPQELTSIPAQGLSGGVQASWTYRYIFAGLTLGS